MDGNHENFDLLAKYQISYNKTFQAPIQMIRPSVYHLLRGEIYTIEGSTFFVMGGASSHDISDGILDPNKSDYHKILCEFHQKGLYNYRVLRKSYWPQELPSDEEIERARNNLSKHNNCVDYILTHCIPGVLIKELREMKEIPSSRVVLDRLTTFFDEIYLEEQYEFKVWYAGHLHYHFLFEQEDRGKVMTLYTSIFPLDI